MAACMDVWLLHAWTYGCMHGRMAACMDVWLHAGMGLHNTIQQCSSACTQQCFFVCKLTPNYDDHVLVRPGLCPQVNGPGDSYTMADFCQLSRDLAQRTDGDGILAG